jgi:serine/threonine-protein kinase
MGKSARRLPGNKLGNWILRELIGGGGNGYVWRVSAAVGTSEDRALKVLKRTSETIFKRFTAEIEALKHAKGIDGIVPLLDEDLNYDPKAGPRWYVMPLAKPIMTELAGADAVTIAEAFVPLARSLAELHSLSIHHRDIKPGNILLHDGRLCFSDDRVPPRGVGAVS